MSLGVFAILPCSSTFVYYLETQQIYYYLETQQLILFYPQDLLQFSFLLLSLIILPVTFTFIA